MDKEPPSSFYCVPCPLCSAVVGEPCCTTGKLWTPPHSERVQRARRVREYRED